MVPRQHRTPALLCTWKEEEIAMDALWIEISTNPVYPLVAGLIVYLLFFVWLMHRFPKPAEENMPYKTPAKIVQIMAAVSMLVGFMGMMPPCGCRGASQLHWSTVICQHGEEQEVLISWKAYSNGVGSDTRYCLEGNRGSPSVLSLYTHDPQTDEITKTIVLTAAHSNAPD